MTNAVLLSDIFSSGKLLYFQELFLLLAPEFRNTSPKPIEA